MKDVLLKNGTVVTMGPAGRIEDGCVLIRDGKVAAVGKDIPADGAETVDARGGYILPGLIDAHCHIGVYETAIGFPGDDGNETSAPVTPEVRAVDGIYPLDPEFGAAVRGGVTAAATGPGSSNPIGGQFAALKTWGTSVDRMVLRAPLAMKIALGENPKNSFGKENRAPVTRMETAALIREWLYRAREYADRKDRAGDDPAKRPPFDLKLEALEPVVRGRLPLKAHCHRADDILTVIRLAKEFGVRATLDHCTEGSLVAEEIAASGFPAILGPLGGFPQKPEVQRQSFETAGVLYRAGVKVAVMTDLPATHLGYLPVAAGLCVGAGLPEEEGFRSITLNAAQILGLSDRIGSLEPGKDGDAAVFSSDPLRDLWSRCTATVVDGAVRYKENSEKE